MDFMEAFQARVTDQSFPVSLFKGAARVTPVTTVAEPTAAQEFSELDKTMGQLCFTQVRQTEIPHAWGVNNFAAIGQDVELARGGGVAPRGPGV